jgi:hypothetical protein
MTSDAMPIPRPPLGERLFEEEPAWTVLPTVLMIFGSLLVFLTALGQVRNGWNPDQWSGFVLGIAVLALGVHLQYVRVTVHENGVLRRTVLGRRELLFSDVAAVQQWGSKIRLLPADGSKPFNLRQSREAEDLRDRLAMGFEKGLLQQLDEQGEVQWAANVWLSRAGIRSSAGFDRESLLPLSSSLRITIDPSFCRVYHPHRNLVPTLAVSDAGFFPGLLLLQRLMKEAPPAEPRPEPAETPGLGEPLAEIRSRWVVPLVLLLIYLALGARDALAWIEQGDPRSVVWWCILSWYALRALLHDRIESHENGLAIRPRLGRHREILLSEIRGLRAEKRFGWYGESTGFELLDPRGRTISGHVLTRNHDMAPGLLRDRIAELMADRLLARMKEEGTVRWGADSRLSQEWIHGRDASGIERSIPLSRGLRFISDGHRLRLYCPGSLEAFLFLDLSQQDAYPGLLVLQHLIERA